MKPLSLILILVAIFVALSPARVSEAQTLEVFQIQGAGMSSPYEGTTVTTNANVVTAVGSEGFFIQTPNSRDDDDPMTSNGLYVADVSPEVEVGFLVDVTGLVVEFFDWTQLHDPQLSLRSTGFVLPAPVDLDNRTPVPDQPWPATELERFEGMRVRVADGVVTAPTDGFGDACIVAASTRVFREPGILYPGIPELPVFDGNPEAFRIAPGGLAGAEIPLVAGTRFAAEGVLAYEFGEYRLWPTEMEVTGVPVVPTSVRLRRTGETSVATQNVERLDVAVSDPPADVRLAKLSGQIREVLGAPDVVAVQEVQDLASLSALADRIRSDDPAVNYTAFHQEAQWHDGFDVGFLVRDTMAVQSVEQIGADAIFSFDGSWLNDRPPLVLETGSTNSDPPFAFTVVVVHQRSLRNIDDPDDGERVRQKRHEQSEWLANWLQQRQSARPEERLIVAGDFNAFEFTDGYVDVMGTVTGTPDPAGALIPTVDLVEPDLVDTAWMLTESERYTYVFDCSAQVLDHVVVNSVLEPWVAAVSASRGNADAPEGWADDPETAARSSDHDGVVLYLGPRWRRPSGRRHTP